MERVNVQEVSKYMQKGKILVTHNSSCKKYDEVQKEVILPQFEE